MRPRIPQNSSVGPSTKPDTSSGKAVRTNRVVRRRSGTPADGDHSPGSGDHGLRASWIDRAPPEDIEALLEGFRMLEDDYEAERQRAGP